MKNIMIHEINISYDDSHERVINFIEYLKSESMKEEVKAYYEAAKNKYDQKIHINDKHDNEFTLEYKGDHNCNLRLREI